MAPLNQDFRRARRASLAHTNCILSAHLRQLGWGEEWTVLRGGIQLDNLWLPFDRENVGKVLRTARGIHKIRLVDERGSALSVPSLGGIDEEGIVYIGQSANVHDRLLEWLRRDHDGCKAFCVAQTVGAMPQGRGLSTLEFKTRLVDDVSQGEIEELVVYLMRFGELPPFNASFSGNKYEAILARVF